MEFGRKVQTFAATTLLSCGVFGAIGAEVGNSWDYSDDHTYDVLIEQSKEDLAAAEGAVLQAEREKNELASRLGESCVAVLEPYIYGALSGMEDKDIVNELMQDSRKQCGTEITTVHNNFALWRGALMAQDEASYQPESESYYIDTLKANKRRDLAIKGWEAGGVTGSVIGLSIGILSAVKFIRRRDRLARERRVYV